ncbi:MAG: hypothetical protein ACTHLW_09930 [Verrucomicrobiota bacterium]
MNKWITGPPDSDTTVLMRVADEEYPILIGFHDGEDWRQLDASLVEAPVTGWMHLEQAANILDANRT